MNSNRFCLRAVMMALAIATMVAAPARAAEQRGGKELPPGLTKIGELKPTFYWVALEENDGQPRDKPLKDKDGNVIATVSAKFLAGLRMEGTGRFLDGRIINFHVRIDGEIRWRWCPPSAPYGYGLEDYVLKPFKSVAVDPQVVPIPSRIFIPAAVGMRLPDGSLHDGYFEAIDIGSAIQNKRIDMFTAYGDQSIVFRRHGITNMKPLEVYLARE
jgi:3D (Asp-Asp-Asp) domain-containing protein